MYSRKSALGYVLYALYLNKLNAKETTDIIRTFNRFCYERDIEQFSDSKTIDSLNFIMKTLFKDVEWELSVIVNDIVFVFGSVSENEAEVICDSFVAISEIGK